MLTNTDKTHDVTITGWGLCDIRFLLVGGGGRGRSGSGAGSGYLEHCSLQVSAGKVLTAQVGDKRQSSSVTLSSGDTYTANPGQDSQGNDGKNGYIGGGGFGYEYGGDNGTNGGDGQKGYDWSGGHGTGEDVSSFTFTAWIIEAGAEGEVYYDPSYDYYFGGGGGGVRSYGERSGPPAQQLPETSPRGL